MTGKPKKRLNTRAKMNRVNAKIKKYLKEKGFHSFYVAPHTLYSKDIVFLENLKFDAIALRDYKVHFIQFKANAKPSKMTLNIYRDFSEQYGVVCCWATWFDQKGCELYK